MQLDKEKKAKELAVRQNDYSEEDENSVDSSEEEDDDGTN